MGFDRHIVFFHCPNSRAGGVRILLEELGADYEMRVLSLKAGQQRAPDYLAVNSMGKVPAIVHGEALITEQPAVYLYLADLYPEAGLAPGLQDPLRFLRRTGHGGPRLQARAGVAVDLPVWRLRYHVRYRDCAIGQGTVHAGRALHGRRFAVGNLAEMAACLQADAGIAGAHSLCRAGDEPARRAAGSGGR